jgi:hypothetical protein
MLGVKDQVSQVDLEIFVKLGVLYKKHNPTTAVACVLLTPSIPADVEDLATKCKIKIVRF